MPATQPPVLSKITSVSTGGKQLISQADLDSGFLADASADPEATLYRVSIRASASAFFGPSGHQSGGGGSNDYDELEKVGTTDVVFPDLMRRADLILLFGYATMNREIYVRVSKVVA